MKEILHIYKTDIHRIIRNWAALIVIIGLMILPSLYAWFNIKASWDPYGNTKGIAIAVVNKDKGAEVRGEEIRIGDEIVASLQANEALGWTFVDEKEALDGVNHGEYYAAITIPEDFSEKITTILTNNPQKPELTYTVNEKINAIAPKITSSGATRVQEEVSHNFVKSASSAIFTVFNEIGIELERSLPVIERVKDMIFQLEKEFPEIKNLVNRALVDVEKAQDVIGTTQQAVDVAQSQLPTIESIIKNGGELTTSLSDFLVKSDEALTKASPKIKQDLLVLQQIAISAEQASGLLLGVELNEKTVATLNGLVDRLNTGITIINSLVPFLERLNNAAPSPAFSQTITKLNNVKANFQKQVKVIQTAISVINKGEKPSDSLISEMNRLSKEASSVLGALIGSYDSTIAPAVKHAIEKGKAVTKDVNSVLVEADKLLPTIKEKIPVMKQLLTDASKGVAIGKEEIIKIQQDLPAIEEQIKATANKIRAFETKEDIGEVLELLRHDIEKQSDFFMRPVLLKENRLFPIPNYGSAMSPFFTTLSLWVGALLLVSLLTVEVVPNGMEYKSYHIYFGRFLLFLTIALMQSFIITMGDIFLLGTYVVDKWWFVLFGLWNSAVFVFIVYSLVSVFGNVGKALGIIMLVLQISGSGGTFPIQVTPPFFQMIYPFLPFTYGISLMREATGGILWDIVYRDVAILFIFVIIMVIIGLLLKERINKSSEKFVKKAKESKVIH
ncbi:YhgE/Pip domain-containing protein [Priestia taiwanensis]|uniref:Phage infection protein n=1 Tax=Priestia taiwanensis TaxID=1347902 RepID=A0A917AJ45_9BACI|nr:YhgE/Pip domain-containing protein [Priestia taiwanensis]MBM7361658.1 putative membrane protein [Priestia taiwanensis]GGE55895.1 phage infection protein [Priestia taiwanensis]